LPRQRRSLSEHILTNTKPEWNTPGSPTTPGRPKYPRGISGEAKAAFKRLVRMLEVRRVLTPGEQEILRLYALTYDRHAKAIAKLAEEGEIVTYFRLDKTGAQVPTVKPNLWLAVAENAEKYLRALLGDLGLNPTTRSKVQQTDKPKDKAADAANDALLSRESAEPTEPEVDLDKLLVEAEGIQ